MQILEMYKLDKNYARSYDCISTGICNDELSHYTTCTFNGPFACSILNKTGRTIFNKKNIGSGFLRQPDAGIFRIVTKNKYDVEIKVSNHETIMNYPGFGYYISSSYRDEFYSICDESNAVFSIDFINMIGEVLYPSEKKKISFSLKAIQNPLFHGFIVTKMTDENGTTEIDQSTIISLNKESIEELRKNPMTWRSESYYAPAIFLHNSDDSFPKFKLFVPEYGKRITVTNALESNGSDILLTRKFDY